jgi:hypothetical protein
MTLRAKVPEETQIPAAMRRRGTIPAEMVAEIRVSPPLRARVRGRIATPLRRASVPRGLRCPRRGAGVLSGAAAALLARRDSRSVTVSPGARCAI